jgi:hypothetical protein
MMKTKRALFVVWVVLFFWGVMLAEGCGGEIVGSQEEQQETVKGDASASSEEAPSLAEEAPLLAEEAPSLAEEAPSLAEEAPSLVEEAPSLVEEAPSLVEEAPPLPEEPIGNEEPVQEQFTVTVNGGTGGGSYLVGSQVTIQADAPAAGKAFAAWTGNIGVLADPSNIRQTFPMPRRSLAFTATYRDLVVSRNPCTGALCWMNAPTLSNACGSSTRSEDFSSGRYNTHRYPLTPPQHINVEITLTRTGGSFEPALIIQNTTGTTLYDGLTAATVSWMTITPLASGQGASVARLRLRASTSNPLYVFVTSWATIQGNFSTPMPTNARYTLSLAVDCPAPLSVCPLEKSRITHFGSGFFTATDSSNPSSPNYNPYKRDTRTSHSGYDLHAPAGIPVFATESGRIISATTTNSGDCGRSVNLAANSGVTFRYCHLSQVLVTSGNVTAGQVIAYNGSTGNANSPHVHFVYLDAPNVTTSGTTAQRSSKVNQYIDARCR